MHKLFKGFLVISLFTLGCAQKQMTVTSATDGYNTLSTGDAKIIRAYEEQWDVLSREELSKAESALQKAKEHTADNHSSEKISMSIAEFEDHYNRSQALADARAPKVQGLLMARRKVISTRIQEFKDESKELKKLDNEFRNISEMKIVDVDDYTELQTKYLQLAAKMIKNDVLSNAEKQVEAAKENKAKKYAPRALNQTEIDIKNAELAIAANINEPVAYEPAVRKANRSAAVLTAIIAEQKKVNYNLDESAALKIVEQSGQIDRKNQMLISVQRENDFQNRQLRDQRSAAETEKAFQAALLSAQKQFSTSEADVFRQGDKILIRLKSIGFASGQAYVPAQSKQLLDRVANVADDLQARQIVVEGHTDSVGSASLNKLLSQKRADNVVSYLSNEGVGEGNIQAVGYGFQKPLSSNKTTTGRAQNRRVDVWITPSEMIETE